MKSKAVAALLAFWLGGLGIHRFYLGQTGLGLAYLIPFLFGLFTAGIGIGWGIMGIVSFIALIDFIVILCTDFDAKYNNKQSYMQQSYAPQPQFYAPQQPVQQPQQPTPKSGKSKTEQLMELKELLDQNILTQEEFDKEKQKILRS